MVNNLVGKIIGIFALLIFIAFTCLFIAAITAYDNEKEEFVVDCYDKYGNTINNVNCTEERYSCNRFQDFFLDKCIGDEE